MISIIIPKSQEAELTKENCVGELAKTAMDYEIVIEDTWELGAKKARGEFFCFLEKDCILGPSYFLNLLNVFREKPAFRKLAMVSPVVGVNSWDKKVYGFYLDGSRLYPAALPSSSEAYLVEVGFFPGSLIRKSALGALPIGEDTMMDSVTMSAYFWSHGNRLVIDPNTVYISTDEELDVPYPLDPQYATSTKEVIKVWKREMI